MTEQLLDALRPLAATIHDEGGRLARSLKGSSADEAAVREHLHNCLKACEAAKALLDPTVIEMAANFERSVVTLSEAFIASGEKLEVIGADITAGIGKINTPTVTQPPPRNRKK